MTHSSLRSRTRSAHPAKRVLTSALLASLLAGTALLSLNGCLTAEEKDPAPVPKETGILFALTSDRKTGGYSVVGLDSDFVQANIDPVHSDAVVRFRGGSDIFIINRYGRDNLQIVDRRNLKTVLQFAFAPLSNPQDVALHDSLVYVSFLGTSKIGIYRQQDGAAQGEIDLSAYADASDSLPETADLLFAGGFLYALTQNLDEKTPYWDPLTPHLLKIDPVTKQVAQAIALPFRNPGSLALDSAGGAIYIPCLGAYGANDGAILAVDLAKFQVKDTVATEAELGGDVGATLFENGMLYLDVNSLKADKVVSISPVDRKVADIVALGPYGLGGIAIDGRSSTLFVGDRTADAPRIRRFDLTTLQEKSKVDLGMPPVSLAVIR